MFRHFGTDQKQLDWLIRRLKKLTEKSPIEVTLLSEDEVAPFLVCTTFIRLALSYAEGVSTLLKQQLVESAAPLERALYERWIEFRYLLHVGSKAENARKFMINSTMELRDFLYKNADKFSEDPRPDIDKKLRLFETDYPALFKRIEKQRKNRHFHWSNISYSQMEREVSVPDTTSIYQYLSWEIHAILSIFDMQILKDKDGKVDGRVKFEPLLNQEEKAKERAWRVGGILFYMWNEYAKQFGLELIEVE